MKTEYQVFWKRVGKSPKSREFKTRAGADNWLELFGPTPWKALGVTYREQSALRRDTQPALEYIGVRVRSCSLWVEEFREDLGALAKPNIDGDGGPIW